MKTLVMPAYNGAEKINQIRRMGISSHFTGILLLIISSRLMNPPNKQRVFNIRQLKLFLYSGQTFPKGFMPLRGEGPTLCNLTVLKQLLITFRERN